MNSIIVYSIIHSSAAAAHHVSYFPSECCQVPARIAKVFALPTPKCSHFRYPDDGYFVRPTWKLYRKQGLRNFVNGGVWCGFLPFNLVLFIVNYGVFSKWMALLTKLFIASESPVRDVWNSVEGDVKWLLNCDFYGHNISNMASTEENSEEVFLPCQSLN